MFACHQHHQPPESDDKISFAMHDDPSVSNTHHTLQVSMYISPTWKPSCRHEIPAFSLQGSIRNVFFSLETALLVTGKKTQQLGIQTNMKTVSSAPISPFPSKSSDETLSNRNEHLDPPHRKFSLFAQFSVIRYHSMTFNRENCRFFSASCRSISCQGISKDRTLMNESLCSLSML